MNGSESAVVQSYHDGFEATRRIREKARHLPGDIYASPEIAALEKDKIFMTNWLCIGRVEEIAKPGDYLTTRIMGEPLLVVRESAQSIIALSNVCRHRGVEVVRGTGNAKEFMCPYHAWVYDLGGKLVSAPLIRRTQVDLSDCRLPRIALETWRGFMFVNFSKAPAPLAEMMGPFDEKFGFLQPERCRLADKLVLDLDCNWKFVIENLMDIYHVGTIHARTFGSFYKGDREKYGFEMMPRGGYSFFFEAAPLTPDGTSRFGRIPWLQDRSEGFACLGFIAPNMNWAARSDNMRMWVTWPISPTKSQLISYTLFPEERFADPGFAENVAFYREFLREIIDEDREMVESLQNGVTSRSFDPGPMAQLETPIHHIINNYLDQLTA